MPYALELDQDMSERGAGAKAARREAAQDASSARFRTTALINLASILEKWVWGWGGGVPSCPWRNPHDPRASARLCTPKLEV